MGVNLGVNVRLGETAHARDRRQRLTDQRRAAAPGRVDEDHVAAVEFGGDTVEVVNRHGNQALCLLVLGDVVEGRGVEIDVGRRLDEDRPLRRVVEAVEADVRLVEDAQVDRLALTDDKVIQRRLRDGTGFDFLDDL